MTNTTEIYEYDEIPYESYPCAQSSPEKLATLGRLFGMNPANLYQERTNARTPSFFRNHYLPLIPLREVIPSHKQIDFCNHNHH